MSWYSEKKKKHLSVVRLKDNHVGSCSKITGDETEAPTQLHCQHGHSGESRADPRRV